MKRHFFVAAGMLGLAAIYYTVSGQKPLPHTLEPVSPPTTVVTQLTAGEKDSIRQKLQAGIPWEGALRPRAGETVSWRDCEVTVQAEPPLVRVTRDGNLIFSSPGAARFVSLAIQDLGGGPEPELIILNDYGGTYPYQDVAVLGGETGETWYQAEASPWTRLADFTGDGVPEFATADTAVGPYKDYPTLLFHVGRDGLTLATDLMQNRYVPTEEQLNALALDSHWPRPALWHFVDHGAAIVQSLIYCGRADLARTFFELGYSPEPSHLDREAYWTAILENSGKSPYWAEILQMNRDNLGSDCPI